MIGINLLFFYFLVFIYCISILGFQLFIKLCTFEDALSCYLCKEMDEFEPSYDYIIVGGGTAGSIIANRLAQSTTSKILLLEAGPQINNLYNIPSIGPLLQLSSVDWQYKTVPQTNSCLGLTDKISNWPMGKLMGGTSRFHNMIYTRGHSDDYRWLKGNDYDEEHDILTYFKRNEFQNGLFEKDTKYHSTTGSLSVQDLTFVTPLAKIVLHAAKALGYSITDLNGGQSTGFMQCQVNTLNGQRWTTADVLQNAKHPNVRIQTNAAVTKILFRRNFHAYAVRFNYFGTPTTIRARKGIVLSAGVIGTPKILMLSGVGPANHLRTVNVPAKIDLPVGSNLQDHVTTGLDLILIDDKRLPINIANMLSPRNAYEYFRYGSGMWTATGAETVAILNLSPGVPDLELMVIPTGISADGGGHFRRSMHVSAKSWREYFVPLFEKQTVTILPVLLHPKSKGTVRLRDNSDRSPPVIDPNYLAEPEDVDVLIRGIEVIKRLLETAAMKKLGARLNPKPFPGCESHPFDSRSYWECYVRTLTITAYHPVGTCSMGGINDGNSVVGFDYRVWGTDNLFVVDGSVFPVMPSGNVNAPIMMMAERAADVIKNHQYLRVGKSRRINVLLPERECSSVSFAS